MQTALRSLISGYIGGGWGKQAPDKTHVVPSSVIRGTDLDAVQSGQIEGVPQRYHTESNVRSRTLSPGDIVFEVSGGSKDQPVGRSILLNAQRLGAFDSKVIPASFCKKITPDHRRINARFLHAHLQLAWADRRIVQWQVQSTGISNFNFESFLDDFIIDLPPLGVQRRIAGILSAYDELMENSQRRIRLLEAMARALYREWFVHFRFPGHDTKSSASDNSPDFVSGMLGDLCGLTKDTYDDAVHSELPLLDLAHMPSRTLAPQDTGHPSELTTSRIVFKKNDTLFGAIRCYLHKVVAAHYSGVTNTSVLVLRPKRPCFRSLLAIIASDAETIRWAEAQSTGTKMPVINWGIFQKMPAPVPSAGLAQEFENIAGPMLDQIGVHAIQIQNLRRTRDLLLPRLLSGQVQIPNTN